MSQIIVTGSTGFVGRNLIDYFSERKFSTIELNLRDALPETLPSADAIVHLAGKAHDLENSANDHEYYTVNTELTIKLFELFLISKVNDFLYFSSVKAVADTVIGTLDETVNANPLTPYGKSKHLAEEYLVRRSLPKGKRIFILRPCMIHGPGNKGNLNLLYKIVRRGIPYPLGAFDNHRSFLTITNLCYILERLITNGSIDSGIYNLADDQPVSSNHLIEIISESIGKEPKIWNIDRQLVRIAAKIGDTLHLPLNSERLKKLTESYIVSNSKIKKALNIQSLPITSRIGLQRTIRSFKEF